jgi:phenylacetate-CoA ligase
VTVQARGDIALILKYAGRHLLKRNPWVMRWCADLMSRESAPQAFHAARQELLLDRVFRQARRIPAYARLARHVPDRNRLAYLRETFPIIDKSTLLQRRTDFFPGGKAPAFSTVAATSGTTGTPLDVHRSLGSILWEEAFHLQHWHWAGWKPGRRQAVLRGDLVAPVGARRPPYWLKDPAGAQLVLSARHLDRQTIPLIAEELRQFGAAQLRAYPSAAYELATLAEEAGIEVRFPAVITGSEMLYEFQRRRIEAVFKTRVFDFYSMAERVAYAAECEYGRMHVNPEYGVLEIVDEHGRPTDDEGTIVGTALHNSAAPLIRYRMNDTARWSREPCPCGRTYPVIEKIGGRLADQLYDLDDRAVNCTVIGFAFDGMRNIEKAQVVQRAADRWVIRIVPGAQYTAADGRRVLDKLAAQVSARVSAQIELVAQIPLLPTGKYKWVVQEFHRGAMPGITAAPPLPPAPRMAGAGG